VYFFLLGVSHRTAPVDLRERLDFSSRDLGAAVEAVAARPSMVESVVLSTCNRSEIYVASTDPARARDELVSFLSDYHHVPPQTFQPHLFALENSAAVAHLFRVAAGLDSLVVGEPQILGQVKDAFQSAADKRCVAPVLSNVFRWSFGVGKRVRTETALGEGAVSVSFAAVALARKIFGRLQGRHVLVVGAGEISSLTAQHLRSQGVGDIVITSRTHAHAEALAAEVGGRAVPWDGMIQALGAADMRRVHVCVLTSSHPLDLIPLPYLGLGVGPKRALMATSRRTCLWRIAALAHNSWVSRTQNESQS